MNVTKGSIIIIAIITNKLLRSNGFGPTRRLEHAGFERIDCMLPELLVTCGTGANLKGDTGSSGRVAEC